MLDLERGRAVYWVRDARTVTVSERAAPLRNILHGWTAHHGTLVVHSAAVGTNDGAVLLVGKGGAGKSTAALACVMAGLRYAGDDYTLVAPEKATVYSLYNSAKAAAGSLGRMPALARHVSNPHELDSEKALLFIHELRPECLAGTMPIRAMLVPRVTGRPDSAARPLSAAASLAALAPSTIFQLPACASTTARQGTLAGLAQLARQVPSFLLESGTDLSQVPCVISRLLAGLDRVVLAG
jgi:hypothetical protein